jgi:ADP-heptose:LPS heptosyltransferase
MNRRESIMALSSGTATWPEVLRQSRKPVAFFANGVGDGVLCTPALRALCSGFGGRVKLILKEGAGRFLFEHLEVERLRFLDMRHADDGPQFALDATEEVLRDCDLLLSFAPWESRSLLELKSRSNAQFTMGFFRSCDVFIPLDLTKHKVDLTFSMSKFIFPELEVEQFSAPLEFPPKIQQAGQEILRAVGGRLPIAFHPESSKKDKCCPPPLLAELVHGLLELRDDVVVCIFGQQPELSAWESISSRVIVFNRLPLQLAAYLCSKMNLFLGVDSCFLHIADISRVPGVGLFGPTDCRQWGFRFSPHIHIRSPGRVADIAPTAVMEAVRTLAPYWTRRPAG